MKSLTRNNLLPAQKRGFVILAMLLIVVIAGSTLALGGLSNRQSVYLTEQVELHREMEVAKQALLAYAANSATFYANARGPGFFPCPDTNNDGEPEASCNSSTALIGRLPEYEDFSGSFFRFNNTYSGTDQQFWYVVGPRYVYPTTASNRRSRNRTNTVSTTYASPYWLLLDDVTKYVALIIAPGEAIATQDRAAGSTSFANYLEGGNGSSGFNYYTSDSSNPDEFNDQILGITLDEYMVVVGSAVANQVKTIVDSYAASNGGSYPADSGSLSSTSCSSTTGTTFSNLFDSSHVWLRDASSSANGNNNERWSCPSGIYWDRNATTSIGTMKFNGCTNLSFTLTYGGGITRNGTGC